MNKLDYTKLDINLKEKTAFLLMPYFNATFDDKESMMELAKVISEVPNAIISINGLSLSVAYNYDFGRLIPATIWETDNRLLYPFPGERDYMSKQLIFECVKEVYPTVYESLRKSAENVTRGLTMLRETL